MTDVGSIGFFAKKGIVWLKTLGKSPVIRFGDGEQTLPIRMAVTALIKPLGRIFFDLFSEFSQFTHEEIVTDGSPKTQ